MELGIAGRTVIVTGASGGIGREIARGFAAEGANVVLTYRGRADDAELFAKQMGERARAVPYDMSDEGAAGTLVAEALDWSGRIDVLINNAVSWGSTADVERTFEEVPEEDWGEMLRTNSAGAIRLTGAVVPSMRKQSWGRIVHVSSTIALNGMAGGEYYGAAKAALHGFNRSTAFSLGRDGDILSNVVAPGLTRTDTNPEIAATFGDQFSELAPIGRLLDAREVAGPVIYLGSAANTGITGQVIPVSGGV